MHSRRAVFVALMIVIMIAVSLYAVSAEPAKRTKGAPADAWGKRADCWQALNLTVEQQAMARQIFESKRAQLENLRADASLTPEQKKTAAKEIFRAAMDQFRHILTPEQLQKMDQIRANKGYRKDGRHGTAMGLFKFGKALNLTAEQEAQIKQIFLAHKAQMSGAWKDASLTPEQRRAMAQQTREAVMAEVRQVLTPEQQQKLDEMKARCLQRPKKQ